jgi:hypothetical protein
MTKIAISTISYVEKPTDIDWAELNDSFVNRDVDILELCSAVYNGHPLCAWMDGRRSAENFQLAQHIGVDMDTGTFESSIDCLHEHPLVKEYGAVIYQTPSHQSHAPKSRVMFLLDEPIKTVDGYRLAIESVYSMFKGADPACVDPARFFFGNGKLRANDNLQGVWFSEKIHLPLSKLRLITRQYLQGMKDEEGERSPGRGVATTGYEEHTLEDVMERLDKVDAYSMDYRQWMKVCSGMKNEFNDAAYHQMKMWSDSPGKDPMSQNMWDSFGKSGTPVTIATVMQVLREHGV